MFAEKLVGLGFLYLVVCFLYKTKSQPTKKYLLWEKVGAQMPLLVAQMPLLNLISFGLGWPWVEKFVGFIIKFTPEYMFSHPTECGKSQHPI